MGEASASGAPWGAGLGTGEFGKLGGILHAFQVPPETPALPQVQELIKREREILERSAQGFTSKKVADALHISYEAVRSHHKNIYRKLQVHSLVEAVAVFRGEKRC
jgi:DNA-binding CsgD family transcriptional regulator